MTDKTFFEVAHEADDLFMQLRHAKAEIERLTLNGIHTCHDQCPRLACVQGREIRRLREALEKVENDKVNYGDVS
jgi:hypothetical protein